MLLLLSFTSMTLCICIYFYLVVFKHFGDALGLFVQVSHHSYSPGLRAASGSDGCHVYYRWGVAVGK